MRFEHVGYNVPDAAAMAAWYVEHLGLRVVWKSDGPPHAHFLADSGDHAMLEIYSNPADAVPDYAEEHFLRFHLAFQVDEPQADRDRLLAAGATLIEEVQPEEGSLVITLRDPWGVPIQMVRRKTPFLPT
jgi:catechol 2,3-dioxygenase-like lactoylglutathione lyase family enzyme